MQAKPADRTEQDSLSLSLSLLAMNQTLDSSPVLLVVTSNLAKYPLTVLTPQI